MNTTTLNKFAKEDLDNILTQAVIISQLSSGITYSDVENMDEYERAFILKRLIETKKEEIEAKQKAIDNMKKGNG